MFDLSLSLSPFMMRMTSDDPLTCDLLNNHWYKIAANVVRSKRSLIHRFSELRYVTPSGDHDELGMFPEDIWSIRASHPIKAA